MRRHGFRKGDKVTKTNGSGKRQLEVASTWWTPRGDILFFTRPGGEEDGPYEARYYKGVQPWTKKND